MKIGGRFHLTYCSNIHAGDAWAEVRAALGAALPAIRRELRAEGPFGVGLRLSARAAASLDEPAALDEFNAFLRQGGYYVFTINGFPYGTFHGERVKERVYLPDWRDYDRLAYTNRLARLLAAMNEGRQDLELSVSTVPGAFRTDVRAAADVAAMADNVLRHAAFLVRLREATGCVVTLAIEPEPACFIETTGDAVDFFTRYLFDEGRVAAIAAEGGTGLTVDEVRRHVGLCFDACHMAVEFEDAASAFARLRAAGIRVCKVQVSSALDVIDDRSGSVHRALRPFAEDTYLHQVVEQSGGGCVRYVDLPDALASAAGTGGTRHWRVHFHVPIFMRDLGELQTTQEYLRDVLTLLRQSADCPYLEVETYTWDVLPPEHRSTEMWRAIARELEWVRTVLES